MAALLPPITRESRPLESARWNGGADAASLCAVDRNEALTILAIVLVAISLRPGIVSMGPILPLIIAEFSLSHTTASLLTAIPALLMGLVALPTPWLARRFDRDRVLMCALCLLESSTILRAFSTNTFCLLASTAGVGAGIAVAGTLVAGLIKEGFPTRAPMLMGIYACSLSFGSTVAAGTTSPVAMSFPNGWRLASGMWSAVSLLAIVGWWAFMIYGRRHEVIPAVSSPRTRLPLCNLNAWLVASFFAYNNFLFYALLSWISPLCREAGLSAASSGFIFTSFMAAFMIANSVFGWLSKSKDRRVWLAACSALAILGLIPIAVSLSFAPFVFIPLIAIGLGGAFTLGMTLPLDNTKSVEEANVWNGFVMTVGYLVAAAGPLVVGHLRDANGEFGPSIWLLVLVSTGMLLLTPFLRPLHPDE